MPRIYHAELAEVNGYLDSHDKAKRYQEYQEAILNKLREFAEQPELSNRIHDVISRASSPHEPLKSRKKIALKLRKWRKTNPKAKVSDVHDIAGLTISCPYPSDVEIVQKYILDNSEKYRTIFSVKSCREIDRSDYRAYHFELHGKGKFISCKAEMQLKTVFARSWGLKTHDLTYKPPGDIDARLQMHIDKLGHILKIVDDQSEIVKDLIEQAWTLDKKRRDAAQRSLLSTFGAGIDPELELILGRWKDVEKEIVTAPVNSDTIMEFDHLLTEYVEKNGSSHEFCRLVCLYALSRPSRDRNDFALGLIDDWIDTIPDTDRSYKNAQVFLCNALMSLGEYEECIDRSKAIVQIAESEPMASEPLLAAKLNHAYYLSEAFYHRAFDEPVGAGEKDTEETAQCGQEALALVADWRDKIEASSKRDQLMDTLGAVLISCGETEAQVREGLDICRDALASSRGKAGHEAISTFFSLHERRAFVRLLQFE